MFSRLVCEEIQLLYGNVVIVRNIDVSRYKGLPQKI